jgi:glutathionylspermidine synthase
MKRMPLQPREDWRSRVERDGLVWHADADGLCWNESAVYEFAPSEIEKVRAVACDLENIFMQAAGHVLSEGLWSRVGIDERDVSVVKASWERGENSLHGRFDLLLDEDGNPKLLEYNSETALLLVESAVVQRGWLQDVMPSSAQWNSIHECLVAGWRDVREEHVHLAWRPRHREVEETIRYMARVVREAGKTASLMPLHRLGWRRSDRTFVDESSAPVTCCYKLYPWEWMLCEPFAGHLGHSETRFIEPLWRLILSSKGMLCLLWELFPDHPALMPCHESAEQMRGPFVSKPLFGHEGQNIEIWEDGAITAGRQGEYENERRVFQQLIRSPRHDGRIAQLGVWMVRGKPVGLGMRESMHPIISGDSSFVPHVIEAANCASSLTPSSPPAGSVHFDAA